MVQGHSVQTWRGCSETISLSSVTPLEVRIPVEELSEESPLRVGVPPPDQTMSWKPGAAAELPILRIQEPSIAPPSVASVQDRDYPVEEASSGIGMSADLRPDSRFALKLWSTPARPKEIEAESLRVSPDAPTEIKYRIWVQPLEQDARHQLQTAGQRPSALATMPGLAALAAAIESSHQASEARLPWVDGLAVQGLATRSGVALQTIMPMAAVKPIQMLYPGSRRLPAPAVQGIE